MRVQGGGSRMAFWKWIPIPVFTQGMDNIWHKVVTQLLELSLIVSWEKFPAEEVSLSRERIQVFGKVRRCRALRTMELAGCYWWH